MLTDFDSGLFWLMVSYYATDAWMWGSNIPNKSYWHGDDDRMNFCYKRVIIRGYVGLGSCGGEPKSQKMNRKSKPPSKVLIFSKLTSFEVLIYILLV